LETYYFRLSLGDRWAGGKGEKDRLPAHQSIANTARCFVVPHVSVWRREKKKKRREKAAKAEGGPPAVDAWFRVARFLVFDCSEHGDMSFRVVPWATGGGEERRRRKKRKRAEKEF